MDVGERRKVEGEENGVGNRGMGQSAVNGLYICLTLVVMGIVIKIVK